MIKENIKENVKMFFFFLKLKELWNQLINLSKLFFLQTLEEYNYHKLYVTCKIKKKKSSCHNYVHYLDIKGLLIFGLIWVTVSKVYATASSVKHQRLE